MTKQTYNVWRLDKHIIQSVEKASIIEDLDGSQSYYESALGSIKANETAQNFIPHFAFTRAKLEKYGSIIVLDGPYDRHIATLSTEELMGLIELNREARIKLESGERVRDLPLTHITHRPTPPATTWVNRVLISTAETCPQCGTALTNILYTDHLKTIGCRNIQLNQQLDDSKLYTVTEQEQIDELTKTQNIKLEYYPDGFRLCVPKWVEGAIDAFNKNSKGYAGMSLHEYLDKIAPTND